MSANSNVGIELVFGGGSVGSGTAFAEPNTLKQALETLKQEDIQSIDTAHLYGESETILGNGKAGDDFLIDSKIMGGFSPGSAKKESILKGIDESLLRLGVEKLRIFYIHAPDYETPLSETLVGINEAYLANKFTRFGISNYKPEDVQAIYDHCKEKNYPLPTAYQGNYSAVARKPESTLLPLLRKLGISFYVYSPMAGGLLTKSRDDIFNGAGRFNESAPGGNIYTKMYKKPSYLDALAEWASIAADAGTSKSELAYRWVAHNSDLDPKYGDGLLIGARNIEQLQETISNIKKGSLSPEIAKRIAQLWIKLEPDAPMDNFHL